MELEISFDEIDENDLFSILPNMTDYDLAAITLLEKDILLGAIEPDWKWQDSISTLTLSFNTADGKQYGHFASMEVARHQIADIKSVPLALESQESLPIRDIPNPIASILHAHNTHIAALRSIPVITKTQKALSVVGIPKEGIHLTRDFILYADWEFFHTQRAGEITGAVSPIPSIIEVSKVFKRSLEDHVFQQVRKSTYQSDSHINIQGCLLVPQPHQSDTIEGQECILYKIAATSGETYPLIVKTGKLKLPVNFFNRVNSTLNFYGEIIEIPVQIAGEHYEEVLMARAIAHLG